MPCCQIDSRSRSRLLTGIIFWGRSWPPPDPRRAQQEPFMDTSSDTSAVHTHRPGRGRVFDSIVDAIGDTPIVRLRRLPEQHGGNATIVAKLENFNPAG